MLVDPAIIHNNDRVGSWERLHGVQESVDEVVNGRSAVGAFNDIAMYNSGQRERWEDRKTSSKTS